MHSALQLRGVEVGQRCDVRPRHCEHCVTSRLRGGEARDLRDAPPRGGERKEERRVREVGADEAVEIVELGDERAVRSEIALKKESRARTEISLDCVVNVTNWRMSLASGVFSDMADGGRAGAEKGQQWKNKRAIDGYRERWEQTKIWCARAEAGAQTRAIVRARACISLYARSAASQ